jgi:hypothetical protein
MSVRDVLKLRKWVIALMFVAALELIGILHRVSVWYFFKR